MKRLSLQGFGLELLGTKKVPKHVLIDFVYDKKLIHTQKRGVRKVNFSCFAVYDKAISSKILAKVPKYGPKRAKKFQNKVKSYTKYAYHIQQIT